MIQPPSVSAPPTGYAERVSAGVLGKLIGVYLGRPVEGWIYKRISATFGEIDRYVLEACDPSPPDTGRPFAPPRTGQAHRRIHRLPG